jgi:hypothetical protein
MEKMMTQLELGSNQKPITRNTPILAVNGILITPRYIKVLAFSAWHRE